ncbi:type II and III secretion system protein family protein [Halomonas sp. MCCC 1A17488]|uniref:type II and III secretion system protein family protein n=1 Tax=Halomonas sp. MCCC 1A17488 TaxID=2731555 RepID=UPI0018D24057|nr:type II and III secretion system protein family protein [Halomonas sp. MCCC 1A17488]MCE8015762.1 type II and III secretion system protein family protein [Halomonas sp. MCCC 1A17488]MCG3239095.1 type II and III secretion system protein family protein [Halomonas sp. MCCC 1A17488]QPP50960.1 type II and III secretion system protein family protein [Halomonas sp. SS10-MC5]
MVIRNEVWRGYLWTLVAAIILGWAIDIEAQERPRSVAMPVEGRSVSVAVELNKAQVLQFPRAVRVVSVGNPEIADLVVMGSRQLYVLGKSTGTTNVVLWDQSENIQGTLNVTVTHDLEALKSHLHVLLPDESIQVRSSQDGIVLSGSVSSAQRLETALQLAQRFAGGEEGTVLNLMQVGGAQQVMLDVKVAEVSRSLVKRLEANFNVFNVGSSAFRGGAVSGGATFPDAVFEGAEGLGGRVPVFGGGTPIGPVVDEFAPATATIEDTGIFASYLRGDYLLNLVLDAASREGVAKILAEPNLTTLTGEPARFLAGGEFPIPVPQGDGQVAIEHKEFGVGLGFLPVVLDSGTINLKVDVSVSDLVPANSLQVGVGSGVSAQFFVPALSKRSASSTLELATGQTIAIAGMLNESLRENVSKLPGLGEVPVLGALFRSQEYIKDQTELVIFVTPRLARSFSPEQVRLPTGSFVPPSDLEFYLLGSFRSLDEEGGTRPRPSSLDLELMSSSSEGGTEGRFGHDL